MADNFRQEMAAFGNRVGFTWLTNFSMEELRGSYRACRITRLCFISRSFKMLPARPLPRARRWMRSPRRGRAPIYSCCDTDLGHGIVGGSMVTFERNPPATSDTRSVLPFHAACEWQGMNRLGRESS
jgi:hypothetical protein